VKEGAEDAPNAMIAAFSIKTQLVDVLFESSAMLSFNAVKLVEVLVLVLTSRLSLLAVALPDGKIVRCDELYRDYPIQTD